MTGRDRKEIERVGKLLAKSQVAQNPMALRKTKQFNMRLSESEFESVNATAKELGLTASEYLLTLHAAYVKEREKSGK